MISRVGGLGGEECPSSADTSLTDVPFLRVSVANAWRTSWKRRSFMPMTSSHAFNKRCRSAVSERSTFIQSCIAKLRRSIHDPPCGEIARRPVLARSDPHRGGATARSRTR
jgi:hypothetical protein